MAGKKNKTGLFGKKSDVKSKKTKHGSGNGTGFYEQTQDFLIVDGVLKKYNGSSTVVNIPDNLNIEVIGQRAFFKRTDIKTVIIPPSVNSIHNYAFSGCENLTSISIPESVTFLGNYAFENCTSLERIELPSKLPGVGGYLFSGCTKLKDITLPYELKTISNFMFHKCTSLVEIRIPDKVQSIGWKAFCNCTSLKEIKLPKKCDSIGNNAFESCYSLSEFHITEALHQLGEGIFFMCKSLSTLTIDPACAGYKLIDGILYSYDSKELYVYPSKLNQNEKFQVPEGVTHIAYGAFSSCTYLEEIDIPHSVVRIEPCAFFNCSRLHRVRIPKSVSFIGKNSFNNCNNLKDIVIPSSINSIEPGLFSGCSSLKKVRMSENIEHINDFSFFGCVSLENFDLPKNLQFIGRAAFSNCQNLTTINIHVNIKTISRGAFSQCLNLKEIVVADENEQYSSIDGVLYDKPGTSLLMYPSGKEDTVFAIPDTVTDISDQAFFGSEKIDEIIIPSSVTDIGLSAFSECPNLTKVTIEEGLENIGTFVFSKNPKLEVINLPKSISSIDPSAFLDCNKISFECSTDSFAYKFASIKNIPLYSERQNHFQPAEEAEEINETIEDSQEIVDINETIEDSQEVEDINETIEDSQEVEDINETIEDSQEIVEPVEDQLDEENYSLDENTIVEDDNSPSDLSNFEENSALTSDTFEESDIFDDFSDVESTTDETDTEYAEPEVDDSAFEPVEMDMSVLETTVPALEPDMPIIETSNYHVISVEVTEDVEHMSDVSNNFDGINEYSNMDGLYASNEGYYNNELFNKNPSFDNNVIFNGDPFNPLLQNYTTDMSSPNNDVGIQPEYSSPNKIQGVSVTQNSLSSVILSWENYPEATEYHLLHFNTKTKQYDDVCKLKTNKALLTGIVPSHIQQYKIIAYSSARGHLTLLASSSAVSVSTALPPVTGLNVISSSPSSLTFSWDIVPDASGYIVYAYNPMKKCFVAVDETTDNFITFNNIAGITNLRIKVVGISIINGVNCMTGLSDEVVGYTSIAVVKGIKAVSVTNNSIKLAWPALQSIDMYKIYAYNNKTERFEYVDSTPINQIVFNHLNSNKEYKFKIRAASYIDGAEVVGAPSEIISVNTTT